MIALVFEKTSTRTRCAFEVAAYHQGAHVTFLDPGASQMGHKESAADTAAVLAGMYDAIEFRGSDHAIVEELAAAADVPVYNGLTDTWHPTQMLADFLTMREHSGGAPWSDVSLAYVGDARYNMGNSMLVMAAIMGADVRIVAPRELWPAEEIQALARERAAAQRGAHPAHRGPGRGRRGCAVRAHRRVGVDGGAEGGLGLPGRDAAALPGGRRAHGRHRSPGRPVHALPARVPRCAHGGRQGGGRALRAA